MRILVLCCLLLAAPAMAQDRTPPSDEIVVKALPEGEKSNWKRAEADHVVVTSDGSDSQLIRVTNNLERLYRLMSRLYRKGATADETVKLQVTLFDSRDFFSGLGLANRHWDEGPYAAPFAGQRYYDARDSGDVIAVARRDQIIKLNTSKADSADCEAIMSEGGECKTPIVHIPATREWEALLYSAFAQHFMLTYTQRVYPRWYLDGIGALFSTMEVRGDGAIDYAQPPIAHTQVYRSYGMMDVEAVLTGRYLGQSRGQAGKMEWTPHHAWLLAHYFTFNRLKPERARQFRDYMSAIHDGAPMAEAAKVFGDMGRLQLELMVYGRNPVSFARTAKAQAFGGDPLVTPLSKGAAAAVTARIEMRARLADEPKARDAWLAALRAKIAALPYDAEAMAVLAEAECRSGHHAACLTLAERMLARAPDQPQALSWKGVALTGRALSGRPGYRDADLAAARRTIERAIKLDGQSPLALIAYFESFTKAGERVPEPALLGMVRAVQMTPAALDPRLALGEELVRQGNIPLAKGILYPLAHGVDDTPERAKARALLGA